MKKNLNNYFVPLIISSVLLFPTDAFADNRLDLRLEGNVGGQYVSNVGQSDDFDGDFLNSYTGSATIRYLAPTKTQVLTRLQAQFNKYFEYNDFDVLSFSGSLTVSQWLFNTLNVYAGLQPVQQISTVNSRRPFDMVYMGGMTYFYPFGNEVAFGGYQIDRLNASAQEYNSLNHTFLIGLQHPFSKHFVGNLGARVRLRDVESSPDDTRFSGNFSIQYLLSSFLTIRLSGEYSYVKSAIPEKTLGLFNFGVNVISGYNNSFKF